MKNLILISIVFVFCTSSCKRYYRISDFKQVAQEHEKVAILPFEIYTSGHVPENITPEMVEEIEQKESTTFQSNFFKTVLSSYRRGRKPLPVSFQHYSQTNSLLKENGLSLKDTWNMDPEKLAKILGVDAVLKARVEKEQYFSDGLSAGIDITKNVISIFSDSNPIRNIPNTNKEVVSDYSLVSKDGTVLWAIGYRNTTNWQGRTDQLVSDINRKSTKHFPYRK